MTVWKLYF